MTEFTYDDIREALSASQEFPRHFTLRLNKGEQTWNPRSTKTLIAGPAIVTYNQYSDGSIEAVVTKTRNNR